jgi:hypothetical protein
MDIATEFISNYAEASRKRIEFAWNGKHAAEFQDSNQDFRWQVIGLCMSKPGIASSLLLEHLFLADAEWTAEAWGSPHHFAQLASSLLEIGKEAALGSFSKGFVRSFDTFGACHGIQLPKPLLLSLIASAKESLSTATDEDYRKRLEAVVELFEKLDNQTATQGWVKVEPGTPVSDIRVVWPRWYHRLWAKISGSDRRAQ